MSPSRNGTIHKPSSKGKVSSPAREEPKENIFLFYPNLIGMSSGDVGICVLDDRSDPFLVVQVTRE